ncbi:complex I NDUFA9 subunit family protein [Qingshengfaniella alkalisoli]|uniref:Complex I NDUFA9 subunit family protein n=1 Tax=Qingshengfaniella alkalisoli TaxID=2599296 RepID=A0A5B8IWN0_9RHOB|nr:complex I NDUFA9 subunit family protein [Qingshengfaniella alkalisoli]QDY69953.1 complex I NDUFA9 subunit family protein [Qingshengfaniella alkalisoli]
MSKLVTIYGGSGFIGRHIVRRMAKQGWRVRVAVRHPNEALFVKPYGVVGQVEPIFCNIRDDQSAALAMKGADAVVNCVGILNEYKKNNFEDVQSGGAERIARLAKEAGIETLVQISAIGANPDSQSEYARTKAEGEAAVLRHMPGAVILRPSIVFGPGDSFFNRFGSMARFGPVLPIVGADTKFQPVYVDNVAEAAEKALLGQAEPGVYELGGPDVRSFREWMIGMLGVIRRRRLVVGMPFAVAGFMGWGFDLLQTLSLGFFENKVLTRDQVRNLHADNVVSEGAKGLADLGISPTPTEAVLDDYLWRFRPGGQYDEITESARNMRV